MTKKMTSGQVTRIRERYAAGGVFLRDLAEEYGISVPTVWQIVHRETWRAGPAVPGEAVPRDPEDRAVEKARETCEMAALRASGMTWQAIGARYGMTLQGARQRVVRQVAAKS